MKKLVVLILAISFWCSLFLFADKRQDLWLKAAAEKNLELRLQYFEQFLKEFGDKKGKHSKYLYFNLAQSSFQLKKYDKSIEYCEQTLEFKDLEANLKLQAYLILANAFYVTKSDIDKAFNYAGLVIEFGKSVKMTTESTDRSKQLSENIDKHFISPACRIQTLILFEKGKDNPENLMEATKKAMEAYNFNKTKRNVDLILSLAYRLGKLDRLDKAIYYVEQLCDNNEGNAKCFSMLGTWYNKKGNKDKAIHYFEKYYQVQEKDSNAAKTALKVGVLLSKKDKLKAMNYFAEAYVLLNSDKESKVYKYLQQLWFNEIAKGKPQAEQDKGFAEIIKTAKTRLNLESE
ncbi:MAG: tetratricopeptide repeat protein [Candidatus Aminicenantes bacterium]|nr:tetratricopeptide repeat protein [Candidatus Aminicenantes bacterium]